MQNQLDQIQAQLNRVETKLDDYAKDAATNQADMVWIKGIVKWGGGLLTIAIVGLTTAFFGT